MGTVAPGTLRSRGSGRGREESRSRLKLRGEGRRREARETRDCQEPPALPRPCPRPAAEEPAHPPACCFPQRGRRGAGVQGQRARQPRHPPPGVPDAERQPLPAPQVRASALRRPGGRGPGGPPRPRGRKCARAALPSGRPLLSKCELPMERRGRPRAPTSPARSAASPARGAAWAPSAALPARLRPGAAVPSRRAAPAAAPPGGDRARARAGLPARRPPVSRRGRRADHAGGCRPRPPALPAPGARLPAPPRRPHLPGAPRAPRVLTLRPPGLEPVEPLVHPPACSHPAPTRRPPSKRRLRTGVLRVLLGSLGP